MVQSADDAKQDLCDSGLGENLTEPNWTMGRLPRSLHSPLGLCNKRTLNPSMT